MKFGGTSVEGATAFKNAAGIVFDRHALRPVVVVSAMAGFTDAPIASVQQAFTARAAVGADSLEKHFDRHLRVIDALQTADQNACATPANWKPGEQVVVPPPQTLADAETRLKSEYDITDWYFAKRTL